MNITFILGNGFDLQLGIKSKYSDFLDEYVKELDTDSISIKEFKRYLCKTENQELWSDAEFAMGKYLGEFSNETVGQYTEHILDFETKMIEYLERQQNRCSFKESKRLSEIFKGFLLNSISDILNRRSSEIKVFSNNHTTINFINFNYTNLLERLISITVSDKKTIRSRSNTYLDQIGNIYHVHGTLLSQIIMGVNDESQLNLSGGVTITTQLKNQLIKSTMNHYSNHNWDVPAKGTIKSSEIILIYGLSFGKTDALWWKEISEWLKENKNHKLIVFVRENGKTFEPRIPWEEVNYEYRKRVEVLEKIGINENDKVFPTLINQTYIILNTKRLNMSGILLPQDKENTVISIENNAKPAIV